MLDITVPEVHKAINNREIVCHYYNAQCYRLWVMTYDGAGRYSIHRFYRLGDHVEHVVEANKMLQSDLFRYCLTHL
jgi:hypothetical protein